MKRSGGESGGDRLLDTIKGKKFVQGRLNFILDFVESDLASMPIQKKMAIALEYAHIYAGMIDKIKKTGKVDTGRLFSKVVDDLPNIQRRLKDFIMKVLKMEETVTKTTVEEVDLPPVRRILIMTPDEGYFIVETGFSYKPKGRVVVISGSEPDYDLAVNEVADLLTAFSGTRIRRCAFPECGKLFASTSIRNKLYHTPRCFYVHYSRMKRAGEKRKVA